MKFFYVCMLVIHFFIMEGQGKADDPIRYPTTILKGNGCPPDQDVISARNEIRQNISAILTDFAELNFCGGTPGWRRVGFLDMTDPSQSCPSGLAFKNYLDVRSCGRVSDDGDCWSTFYNTGGSYSRVCGRIRGYQLGATSAFFGYNTFGQGIDSYFVEGITLTHGLSGSRTHIWTFTAGLSEVYISNHPNQYCTCATNSVAPQPPPFVGNDYFCESGLNTPLDGGVSTFYPNDPLWDGQNCVSTCCHPPYFTKTLPAQTDDNIELRLCCHDEFADIPIDQVELYVQ